MRKGLNHIKYDEILDFMEESLSQEDFNCRIQVVCDTFIYEMGSRLNKCANVNSQGMGMINDKQMTMIIENLLKDFIKFTEELNAKKIIPNQPKILPKTFYKVLKIHAPDMYEIYLRCRQSILN